MSGYADALPDGMRAALLAPEDAAAIEIRATVQAAVLVPLFLTGDGVHAVFTERHHDLPRHAGEISFPGGRRETSDEDLVATALRETHEEIGLPAGEVEIIGALEPTPTMVTGYAIYPFVGIVPADYKWKPHDGEVAAVIELPLKAVAAGYARRTVARRAGTIRTDTYLVDGHTIWGATARIVADLLERIEVASAAAASAAG
jgi:8-oxo-dGTP pyrophosphatase MutT (NUDIX family)